MKKILNALALILVAWFLGYTIVKNVSTIFLGSEREKALDIFGDNACVFCHTKAASAPFYAKIPLVGSLIKSDIENGLRSFDISPTLENLKNNQPPNATILAKLAYIVKGNEMPPLGYKIFHWRSNLSTNERAILLSWIKNSRIQLSEASGLAEKFKGEPIWPIPQNISYDKEKARLGQILYNHTALSGDNTISCASCHDISSGGADGLQFSKGIREQKGELNAPTVLNAAFNTVQFWDGRANTLEEQASGPPMNPTEMDGGSWEDIANRLAKDSDFKQEFEKIYPDGFSEKNITSAIGNFERTLITPNCRFDRYLRGEENAVNRDEIEGYALFKEARCASCHAGQNLGGQNFEYMGLKHNYFAFRGDIGKVNDKGLASHTKDPRDTHKFKTPTLRNVELTAPYFHDGTVATLEMAVEIMAKYQRGRNLSPEEIEKIVKFLKTLTGELNGTQLETAK